MSAARRRSCVEHVTGKLGVSERFACRVLGQHRSVQRKVPRVADDEAALTENIISLARRYGRYGYRRITALLRAEGWSCNHKRVERIWRREGLKVPSRQARRGRLWLADGSCVRLRPERPNHVWAYDFVEDRTRDGRRFRMLNVVDEYTRECLTIRVGRKLKEDYRKFRVWLGMMGRKEFPHGPTQRASDPGCYSGPAAGGVGCPSGL